MSLEQAEQWRVRAVVERGVLDAYAAAQLDVPVEWRETIGRPYQRRDLLVDRAYLGDTRRPLVEELAYLRLMTGWRDRWRYLHGYSPPIPTTRLSTDDRACEPRPRTCGRSCAGDLAIPPTLPRRRPARRRSPCGTERCGCKGNPLRARGKCCYSQWSERQALEASTPGTSIGHLDPGRASGEPDQACDHRGGQPRS